MTSSLGIPWKKRNHNREFWGKTKQWSSRKSIEFLLTIGKNQLMKIDFYWSIIYRKSPFVPDMLHLFSWRSFRTSGYFCSQLFALFEGNKIVMNGQERAGIPQFLELSVNLSANKILFLKWRNEGFILIKEMVVSSRMEGWGQLNSWGILSLYFWHLEFSRHGLDSFSLNWHCFNLLPFIHTDPPYLLLSLEEIVIDQGQF